ncbi:OmpA family protein [Sediminicola sp. 1XM1-17]|uniref:OmpA family protein n=1 Tax=Sediminicola sp. 1XM1-17 TaxID=3127702 RepID=UPI003078A157
MKNLLTTYIFLLAILCSAQGIKKNYTASNGDYASVTHYNKSRNIYATAPTKRVSGDAFKRAAAKNNINSRTFYNLKGAEEGYYIVSGVFSDLANAKKLVQKLKGKGFNAGYINNSNNGLNYVYLAQYDSLDLAINSCNSQLNGTYQEPFWLMNVDNGGKANKIDIKDKSINPLPLADDLSGTKATQQEPKPTDKKSSKSTTSEQQLSIDEVTYEMLNAVEEEEVPVNKRRSKRTVTYSKDKDSPNATRLIQKADEYFNKMWYAEAAELYEEALKKDPKNYSFTVLEKAGDAYYYNTDMPKAYYWYNVLYERYEKDMTPDQLFKYAHTLKGTGKYGRSKRLMRLYDQEMGKSKPNNTRTALHTEKKEAVLDNILSKEQDFGIKNLAINTKYSEFSPMFHNKDEIVFASAKDSSFLQTRRYKWNNQPYLDLYVSKINQESQDLKSAIKFSKKINTKYHEASVTFAPDNLTMYFTRNNYGKKLKRAENGDNNLKIYRSVKIDGEWTEAEELPFNSDEYSTGHPALSPDGTKLYFVSDMPGSIGQTDIFVVDVLENGQYSAPKNLGPGINTEQKEMFPFINDKKLYFASNGHVGLGGLDVYEVAYDEEGFKEVVNMGQPINSNKDDFSYIVNEDNQKGYFASNRKGGKGDDDIYSFERLLVEEIVPNQNAIAGVVTELVTGDIMPQSLVTLLDENNIKLKEMVTGDDGSFLFEDLEGKTKYTIKVSQDTYFDQEQQVTTKDNELINIDISIKKLKDLIAIENGIRKLKTDMIYFDFDKFNIRSDASLELDKVVNVMNEYPEMVIKIESHTDSRGNDVYNKYLSDRRAKSTRDYIISKGIDAARIESAIGYGEEQLINECKNGVRCSGTKHELNRRSEIIIVNM